MATIEGFELSPQQKHLWKLQSSSPNLPYYARCAVQIKGKIEASILKTAIEQVISSHEILRTTFKSVPRMTLPLQVIAANSSCNFTHYDYRGIELETQLHKMELLWKQYNQLPWDFSQNLLFHCTFVTLSQSESVLLINVPALYSDIKGLDNLVCKILSSYGACTKGEEFVDEVIQYADISEWQNQLLNDEEQELILAKAYWRKQNITDCLSEKLPCERQLDGENEFAPRYLSFTVIPSQVGQISEFLQKQDVSLDLFLLTCWQILLWRITQQSQVVVGVGFSGRKYEELQDSIGLLAKYLPLKSSFQEGLLFEDVLRQIQLELKSIDNWQEQFTWESIIDENKSYINNAFIPFGFDFNTVNSHIVDDICFGIVKQDICFDKFKVKLSFTQNQHDLVGKLYYDAKLFDEDYIQCLAEQFQTLLSSVVDCPEILIDKIGILSDVEREKILLQFNDTSYDYPKDKYIHQLFEEQVEETPDAVAVVFEDEQLTYQQLNQRANQLANYLQILGVEPEVLVGICTERSVEMLVGLLGVLKAGGAYVPLDPSYPQERLNYMLADSGVGVLLTQQSLLESLPSHTAQVVCLDSDWETIKQKCGDNLNAQVKLDNLAYVVYTSGSTGVPKGVAIEHKSILNYVCSIIAKINVKPNSNFALVSTISADLGNTVIFPCLLTGGCLHVISQEKVSDPNSFGEYFTSYQIEYLKIVPSHLAALQASSNSALAVPSQTLILGGEASNSDWIETIQAQSPHSNIINHYGPTEATVGVLTYSLDAKSLALRTSTLPIGRPIANTQIYILDSHLQPVPIGVPGELHIGGAGLARGYLNQPELTKEKFIPNPFNKSKEGFISPSTSPALYKTGDLARYLPDGNIEFLGRIDNQVKIRGFRIELGEIEAVLCTHPQIQQAVVIATEDIPGNKRLVGYIVSGNESLSTQQLREFLKQKLPEYMVPVAFVTLDTLPLTPNGKVDRKALPAPDGEISREHSYVAPRTPNEEIIADIFADVLSVSNVGIHDNFFELGGHSLLATSLISRLKIAFEVEIPLQALFQSPTVAQLNQNITQLRAGDGGEKSAITLPTIVAAPENKSQPFPLTDIQQAYWLGRNQDFHLGNISAHNYIELDCSYLNLPQLNQAWQKLIEYHDMLRAVVLTSGEQQILQQVPAYEIEVLDLRSQSPSAIEEQLGAIREQMSHEVLPVQQWPLFKIRATILDEKRTRLHLSFDALIADAWSNMLLGQQWQQLYENPQTPLPPLEISFRDYVLAELLLKDTPQYQQAQEYWFNRHLPPAPGLPFALNPSSITKPEFRRYTAQLQPEEWQQLKQRAARANLTPSAVLLEAFADILNYWSTSPNFTINLTLFNRLSLHPQVNQVLGDFTSLTLLEVDCSIPSPFTARVQRLQQQLWQDLDHRYISGVEVQRDLRRRFGNVQPMGIVFTSTLGLNSLRDEVVLNQLGEIVYNITQTPQVWLDHQVFEEDGGLRFNWDVVEQLFPPGLIDDMFAAYCNWLQQLANSDGAWDETYAQLLPPTQLASIGAVNNTSAPISQETLHSLFQKQVAVRSQCSAVISPQQTLTYGELNQLANNLAHELRQLGVTPNTLVAVIMEKGWEQIVAVLGILMSGGAYLPISPEFPQQRQWYLLSQGQVELVITQPQLEQNLCLPEGIKCLSVNQEKLKTAQLNPINSVQTTDDLAYVIYTSGSTGNPKGVMIDHKGAVNTILDINRRFGVGVDDRVLAISALEFDLSVYDIFGVLAAGGAIVMPEPSPGKRKDPTHWLELINAHQVTLWNTVPALMQMLVEHLSGTTRRDKQVGDLRLALLSGDWLPVNLPPQIQSFWSNIEVISLGGATEASIWSILYPIEKVEPHWKSIPYGFPMDNQRFYVLNQLMQQAPIYVAGELYIGGMGLAKGYWQDGEKTKNSFITHPITQERLYKTGDLGRYLPGGEIEFLGREDFQVKINGYRIELGEIEAVLKQHPAIKETVVNSYNNQLVAYVVPEQNLTGNDLINSSEASQPEKLSGVVLDPVERMEFKLQQPGLRQFSSPQSTVDLPLANIDEVKSQAYLQRQSYRQFLQEPIPLADFSEFLSCLLQMKLDDFPLPKYRYPSAGNLYPVQTYLLIRPNGVQGLSPGIYYYHPGEHRLILVNAAGEIEADIYGGNQSIFEQSAFSIFLIGKISAIAPMYGELARNFCLLEAGHIGQLLMENAPKKEIGLCPIGNLEFSSIESKFELESNQPLLYSFVGGKIDLAQTKHLSSSANAGGYKSISTEMRKYLTQKLPSYMVPNECIILETLPLTANGKVDRKALPIPDISKLQSEIIYVAPRNSIEEQLVEIWSEFLEVSQIGIHDNFFTLGGNSLGATQAISRIRETFQVEFSLQNFFEGPTVSQVAEYLEVVNRVLQVAENLEIDRDQGEI